jgi:hypothetical protein
MARHESTVRRCTCAHAGQDQLHGSGLRVHNQTKKGNRCTVCSNESIGGGFEGSLTAKAKK